MDELFALFFRLRLYITLLISGLALAIGFLANRADLPWIALICLVEMILNQPYLLTRRWKGQPAKQGLVHLAGDALIATAALHFFGGISSGLLGAFYLFIIFFAAAAYPPRTAIALGLWCFTCFLVLFLIEEFGMIPKENLISIPLPTNLKLLTLMIAAALFLGTGVVGVLIAQLFRSQAGQLSESEARYRGIFECSSDGMFIVDASGKFVALNPAFLERTGYTLEQALGQHFTDFVVEESIDDTVALYQNVLQGERVVARDLPLNLSNGRRIILEISAAPIKVRGNIVEIVAVTRDVTERKLLEDRLAQYSEELEERTAERTVQLQEAKMRYQGLFENAAVPLAWLDRNGRFLSVNKKLAELAGGTSEQLLQMRLMDLLPDPEDQLRAATCVSGLSRAEDSAGPLAMTLRPAGAANRIAELYLHLDPNQKDLLLSLIDITSRKEIEQEQQSLQTQLIQAEKMALVGQLAAGVAHEVNNPLTAISYYAQTLSRDLDKGQVPVDTRDKLRKIEEGAERIQELLAKLLAYARPKEEERRELNLNQVVEQALDFAEYELDRHRSVAVQKELWPNLEAMVGDPHQLLQVVVNLLLNAIDAIGDNPGQIRVLTRPGHQGVELVCEDNGEGIHHRDLPHIFTPFFTTKASSRGTGLGLAIVKRIVEDHGGRIRVESQRGHGTTFFIAFPRLAS